MTTRIPKIPMDEAFSRIGYTHSIQNNNVIINRDHFVYNTREGVIKDQFILTQNNLKNFKEIFGAPEFSYQGEYREYVWFHMYEDITLILYTGERGTAYEVKTDQSYNSFRCDTKIGETIIRFLTNLTSKLKTIQGVNR